MTTLDEYIESQIFYRLKEHYNNRYKIEKGKGDRIIVNGKTIKGILFTPPRQIFVLVEIHINQIIQEINIDIKKGRFL